MAPAERVDAYLICATPRSGSTLLCGLLRSTGVAGRPESYFRRPDEQSWARRWRLARGGAEGADHRDTDLQDFDDRDFDDRDFDDRDFDYREFLAAAVAEGSTDNGIFGARVMWGTMDELVANLRAVHPDVPGTKADLLTRAFGRTRFLHLRREDAVAQAVSWARAEQTNFWHPGDPTIPAGRRPSFDYEQIHGLVDDVANHNAAWRRWFAASGVEPYPVTYEQLVADLAGVTRNILNLLGVAVPASQPILPQDQRQADQLNDEWIARYRAISASVSDGRVSP